MWEFCNMGSQPLPKRSVKRLLNALWSTNCCVDADRCAETLFLNTCAAATIIHMKEAISSPQLSKCIKQCSFKNHPLFKSHHYLIWNRPLWRPPLWRSFFLSSSDRKVKWLIQKLCGQYNACGFGHMLKISSKNEAKAKPSFTHVQYRPICTLFYDADQL